MSFVTAATELMQGAGQNLAGIGSSLADAATAVSGPTTGVAAAAEDEISIAIASIFGDFGEQFQAVSAQAQAFHSQFVNLMNSGVGAYASAEVANAQQVLSGALSTSNAPAAAAAAVDPLARIEQVIATTAQNAETVFGAWDAGVTTLVNGVSSGFNQLLTNPTGFLTNLQNAVQAIPLVGAPSDLALNVTQHTLGGITAPIPPTPEYPIVLDAHGEVYRGLIEGFLPEGAFGQLLAGVLNFAASPLSGVLMGAVGPFASPGVALLNSFGGVLADITGGDVTSALYGLINTPANVVDGFFNGAVLNLDSLAPVVNGFISGPTGGEEQVTGLSLGFGGLFSPGQVVYGASGPVYNGVGGSFLNSVGVELTFDETGGFLGLLPIPAAPVGPIGAVANLFSIFGQALSGSLQPPPPLPI